MGFVFQPVKEQGLAAAGTTPFGVLFLAFSCFIILAAVMLVALLFRLGSNGGRRKSASCSPSASPARQVARLPAAEGFGRRRRSLLGVAAASAMPRCS